MKNTVESIINSVISKFKLTNITPDIVNEIATQIKTNPESLYEDIMSTNNLTALDNFNKMLIRTALTKVDINTKRLYIHRLINEEVKP
jgi:GH35 family endo-1,4-beta-xylanase